ncbi:nickel-dependent lactate racemase [Clostridium sp.]|uniref:nickel-dependent lactate racemase n=1 Tax=Clostridium sp. TaxID=1506 RepID=UPI001A3D8A31|nr:nickel-dependent lactate racemase [Clostridium sp.]MBK5242949.1 nickel-dependent lactate racemase [Clostridium sp.]
MDYRIFSGSMTDTIYISDECCMGVVKPIISEDETPLSNEALLNVLDNPFGRIPIQQAVNGLSTIAIIVDDATRPTPTAKILPLVLKKLLTAGVRKDHITITIATGLHRPTTIDEKKIILGDVIFYSYDVADNDAYNEQSYRQVGVLANGKKIYFNKRVLDVDYVITIGMVKSHAFAGFSGGAKSLLPGVSNKETILANHSFENIKYPKGILGNIEQSATRREMEEAAGYINPFIINVMLNSKHEIVFATAGHYILAHRQIVDFYSKTARRELPYVADIAIVYGGDVGKISLYHSLFACNTVLGTERPILKRGGTLIIFAECKEGLGTDSFNTLKLFSSSFAALESLKDQKPFEGQWAVQCLLESCIACHLCIVSSGLDEKDISQLDLQYFSTLAAALSFANATQGDNAKIVLVENPETLILNVKN